MPTKVKEWKDPRITSVIPRISNFSYYHLAFPGRVWDSLHVETSLAKKQRVLAIAIQSPYWLLNSVG